MSSKALKDLNNISLRDTQDGENSFLHQWSYLPLVRDIGQSCHDKAAAEGAR